MPEFERAHKSQQADYLSEIEKLVRQKIADGQVAASFTEDQNAALTECVVPEARPRRFHFRFHLGPAKV